MKKNHRPLQRVSIDRNGKRLPTLLTQIRIADSFLGRLVGLLSRSGLDGSEGLLITPCASIHTLAMRFTIDLVFLDKENKVLGTRVAVPPNRFRLAPKGTFCVLELADGNVSHTGINLDDRLIFD